MKAKSICAALVVSVTGTLVPAVGDAETVVARKRLGNNTEGMTYKSNGTLADRAVAIDGDDVISIALGGTGHQTLFSALALDPLAHEPRGIAWNPANQLFYFSSKLPQAATELFVADQSGTPQTTLNLVGLADPEDWGLWEGLAYIPSDAPAFPGSIVGLGTRSTDFLSHIFYIDPQSGAVLGEIVPQPGSPVSAYLCGIQYWPQHPGTLLVTDCGTSGVYQVDMVGGVLLGSQTDPLISLPEAGDIESVIVRSNGELYLNGYETGHLYAYDTSLNRAPGFDREFLVGFGISAGRLAWNYDTSELVVTTRVSSTVYALPKTLKSARVLFDLNSEVVAPGSSSAGLSYLGGNRLAVGVSGPTPGIDILDMATGQSTSRLVMTNIGVRGVGQNGTSTWLMSVGNRNNFRVFTRNGTADSSIFPDGADPVELDPLPLSSPTTGPDAVLFDSGQGLHVFTGAEIYDLDGHLTHTIDQAALGITDQAGSGTWLGGKTFAVEDGDTSTVIVFTIP